MRNSMSWFIGEINDVRALHIAIVIEYCSVTFLNDSENMIEDGEMRELFGKMVQTPRPKCSPVIHHYPFVKRVLPGIL